MFFYYLLLIDYLFLPNPPEPTCLPVYLFSDFHLSHCSVDDITKLTMLLLFCVVYGILYIFYLHLFNFTTTTKHHISNLTCTTNVTFTQSITIFKKNLHLTNSHTTTQKRFFLQKNLYSSLPACCTPLSLYTSHSIHLNQQIHNSIQSNKPTSV